MSKVKNLPPTTVPVQTNGIDEDQEASIHSFPRDFAKEHGVKEAIVLGFLAYKVRRSKNLRDGKKWFYDSLENIATRYSYIPKSTLADILKRLEGNNIIEVSNYNKKSYDRTCWYTVPKQFLDAAAEVPIKFNSKIAESIGIAEAVLVYNLTYFVTLKITLTEPRPYHSMPPGEMAGRLPIQQIYNKESVEESH